MLSCARLRPFYAESDKRNTSQQRKDDSLRAESSVCGCARRRCVVGWWVELAARQPVQCFRSFWLALCGWETYFVCYFKATHTVARSRFASSISYITEPRFVFFDQDFFLPHVNERTFFHTSYPFEQLVRLKRPRLH